MGQTTSSLQPPEGLEAVTLADVRRAVVVHRKRLGGAVLLSARQAQQLLQPGLKDDEARAVEAAIIASINERGARGFGISHLVAGLLGRASGVLGRR